MSHPVVCRVSSRNQNCWPCFSNGIASPWPCAVRRISSFSSPTRSFHYWKHTVALALEAKAAQAGADRLAIWKDAAGRWPIIERESFVLLQPPELSDRHRLQYPAALPSDGVGGAPGSPCRQRGDGPGHRLRK